MITKRRGASPAKISLREVEDQPSWPRLLPTAASARIPAPTRARLVGSGTTLKTLVTPAEAPCVRVNWIVMPIEEVTPGPEMGVGVPKLALLEVLQKADGQDSVYGWLKSV
jgi:hypothetical protein